MRSLIAVACAIVFCACGVAPVRWDGSAAPPPQWTYVGAHGRPLAYGGGVCTVTVPHPHKYPPAPIEHFEVTSAGAYDTRALLPFVGRHPHHGRTCHMDGWHLHTEAPDPTLVFDDETAAWRVRDDVNGDVNSPAPSSTAIPSAG